MSASAPFGGHADFFGDKELEDWVKTLLWTLNGFTTIITVMNLMYLRSAFPKVVDIPSRNALETSISSTAHSLVHQMGISSFPRLSQSSLNGGRRSVLRTESFIESHRGRSPHRGRIQKYFYIVSCIPCCVSYAGHYGARFPEDASWIFPGMNIAIGIGFLAFIRMMVMSCEGWQEIKRELLLKPDECASMRGRPLYRKCCRTCCCKPLFLKENAYEGLKQRILFCCLILVKPLINYAEAMFEIDYHSSDRNEVVYSLKALCFVTTFVPLNVMRSFHGSLLPYTRLRRSGIKRFMIAFLAPVCQIQELIVNFVWGHADIRGFEGIEDRYRWNCAYGIILVIEMAFVSLVITSWAYRPKDLRLWEYPEHFLRKHGYSESMADEDFLFGKVGISDNVDEHVPDCAYIREESCISMDSRIMSRSSLSQVDKDGL